jgi:hypothetical protein
VRLRTMDNNETSVEDLVGLLGETHNHSESETR